MEKHTYREPGVDYDIVYEITAVKDAELANQIHFEIIRLDEPDELFAKATIKWDGCMDVMFSPDLNMYLHFCNNVQAKSIGNLLDYLYQIRGCESGE